MATKKNQQFKILHHELVPHHEIVSEKEKEELYAQFKVDPSNLPKILDTDPVVISIGAKPGQIVKILRESDTAKVATAYRLVIESNK